MHKLFPSCCCKEYCCNFCLCWRKVIRPIATQNIISAKAIILGNVGVGKSTFLKQMKLIYGSGFSVTERRQLIPIINQQILNIARCICQAMVTLEIPFENSKNEDYARLVNNANSTDDKGMSTLSPEFMEAIKNIWSDRGVQLCYSRRREYQLTDSAKYLLDNIDRISEETYLPTDDDILRVRIPTTDIVEEDFQFSHCHLQIVDVGGHKIERKKWIHCFDNVTTVIFFASLIDYDYHVMDESSKYTLMEESLSLFHVILTCEYFNNASIILFLNKIDLFPEWLAHKSFRYTFPEFDGADDDINAARTFIEKKYLNLVEKERLEGVETHFTCSIDKKNIQIVCKEIKDQVLYDVFSKL